MKFLLIVYICSAVNQDCTEPIKIYPLYNSHYDCSLGGYFRGLSITTELGQKEVNKSKIFVNFQCQKLDYS